MAAGDGESPRDRSGCVPEAVRQKVEGEGSGPSGPSPPEGRPGLLQAPSADRPTVQCLPMSQPAQGPQEGRGQVSCQLLGVLRR